MTKLGGWWMSTYRLDEDEELVTKYPTNYFQGDSRPLGGRLYLTDSRAIFLPHRIDSLLGGSAVPLPYDRIRGVRIETPDDRDESTRMMPERLQIDTTNGKTHLFVVSDVEKAHRRMKHALDGLGPVLEETDEESEE